MYQIRMETKGLKGWWKTLMGDTQRDVLSPLARAGDRLVARAQEKLSSRAAPSGPGDPPAKVEGALRDSIGRTGPFTESGKVSLAWGVGVGDEALARVNEWKSQDVNVFEYAALHEFGGHARPRSSTIRRQLSGGSAKTGPRRFPPRPYIRPTEDELEAAITSAIRRAL